MKYDARVTQITVQPDNQFMNDEKTTVITIKNEGGGEFVEIEQMANGKIGIDPDEWPLLRDAIQTMIDGCKNEV